MNKRLILLVISQFKISIKTLNIYIPNRFEDLFKSNMYDPKYDKYGDYKSNELDLIWEIEGFGLKKIKDLETIIKTDLIEIIKKHDLMLNYLSLMRLIMITGDFDRYFKGLNSIYSQWDLSSFHNWDNILMHYNITPEMIDSKIKEQELAELKFQKK